jgi:uncharacterized protein (TIGR02611 family)
MNRPAQNRSTGEPSWPGDAAVKAAVRHARRAVVAVVGVTLLLIGAVMIVTPGPALVVIPLGLVVLAAEFAWARRLLRRVRARFPDAMRARPHVVEEDRRDEPGDERARKGGPSP